MTGPNPISAELSHSLQASDCRRHAPKPESFGMVVCWFVGNVPAILGFVWPSFRPKSGSKSKIPGRLLQRFRGPSSSAELCAGTGWSTGAAHRNEVLEAGRQCIEKNGDEKGRPTNVRRHRNRPLWYRGLCGMGPRLQPLACLDKP